MKLVLRRKEYGSHGVFGVLEDEDGNQLFHTLERAYRRIPEAGSGWRPKVPAGLYKCVRGKHCLRAGLPFDTFEVTGVPGRTGILFHVGNYASDSEGCILLGRGRSPTVAMITRSKEAFQAFMQRLGSLPEFTLEVI